jgi:hypothetical protein
MMRYEILLADDEICTIGELVQVSVDEKHESGAIPPWWPESVDVNRHGLRNWACPHVKIGPCRFQGEINSNQEKA